jgi:putative ABC transport system ATP-binding protein
MKATSNFPSAGKTAGTSLGKGCDQDSPGVGLKWSYESARKFDCEESWRNFSTVNATVHGPLQSAHWRNVHIGYVFQTFNLTPVLTAFENVELPLLLTKLNSQQRRDHVMTALKLVGLEERVNHLPKQLSGGQEQRVAIARAIVSDPTLLLADEPTGDLDSHSATEVLEILKRLNEDFHKTVVMVTDDPHAASYAHVTRHLEKGMLLPA